MSHTHKYFKSFIGWGRNKKEIYRCALPDCPHYVFTNLVLMRNSICWNCGKEFVLPKAISLLTSKPWCPECAKKRKKKPEEPTVVEVKGKTVEVEPKTLDSFIEDLIGGKS